MIMNTYRCKVLLTLSLFCVSMVSLAQDIIVKKDGTTIKAKVERVTDSVIEYKKFSNLTGPTYSIKILDLLAINYENGETETFSNTETVTSPSNEFFNGGERRLSDAQLLALSRSSLPSELQIRKGKRMKIAGLTLGSAIVAGGIIVVTLGCLDFYGRYKTTPSPYGGTHYEKISGKFGAAVGIPMVAVGVGLGTSLFCAGQKKINYGREISSTTLLQYEMPLGNNSNLSADVNLITDNVAHRYTPGVGFHINF